MGIYLAQLDWASIGQLRPDFTWLIFASIAAMATRLWFAQIWLTLLKRLGANVSGQYLELLAVYSKAWLGRYVPGGAVWIVGKVYFASKLGISKAKLAISSFLEGALQVIVVLISATALLAFDSRIKQFGDIWAWGLGLLSVVGFVMVLPPVFNRAVSTAYRLVKKQNFDPDNLPDGGTITAGIIGFAASAALSGFSYFLTAKALAPQLGVNELLYVIGTSNLASALSMLAVFAPAGLGVREAIQLATLLVIVSPVEAIAITVFIRLWSIAMDLVFYLIVLAIAKFKKA